MSIIYLVRHGETINNVTRTNNPSTYNSDKRCPDPPLNDIGIRQAHLLGARLKSYDISSVYSSDLLRTQETAKIINEYIDKIIVTRTELREIDMGELHLRSREELKEEYPDFYQNWDKHERDMPYPNGECGRDVENRVKKVIDEIIQSGVERTLVVTHGGVIRVLLSVFLGLPMEKRFNFFLNNCGITTVEYVAKENRFRINTVNDNAHWEVK